MPVLKKLNSCTGYYFWAMSGYIACFYTHPLSNVSNKQERTDDSVCDTMEAR